MKAGFCLHKDWAVTEPDLLKRLDELGYNGVEIWEQAFDAGGIEGVEKAMMPYNFEVVSVNPYLDFTASEETFNESLKKTDDYIDFARRLKSPRIRVYTSKLGSFETSEKAEPVHWERAINGIRELCDRAAPHGIQGVMEVCFPGGGQLFDTSATTMRIMKEVDRPNLTVNLQVPLRDEDPIESAEKLGPYVTHLHANNWSGKWGDFTFMDQGDPDFSLFLKTLHKHGFDGYVSVEHAHKDPIGFAEHNIRYLRSLFGEMRV